VGTGGQNCLHRDAAAYYYELAAQHEADVPDAVVRHVCGCLVCRARIERLRKTIAETTGGADLQRGPMDRDIIEILNLHFRSLGEPVTCSRVKPFLPGLLDPLHQIRIPTPITVHLDHCPQCAADLAVIWSLALQPGQLERLGRLYAAKSEGKSSLCRRARLKIPAFAAASLDGIEGRLLNHLCTCQDCRAQVYQYRQNLLERGPAKDAEAGTECRDALSTADIFDYVVAYDLPEADAAKAGGTERPTGAHVRTCRRCLERIQTLHHAAYGVAERPDSDVVTIYRTTENAREAPAHDDPYPNYPIDVQVVHRLPERATTRPRWPAAAAALGRTASALRAKPLLKAAIVVAAAAIPLAFLFLNTHTAAGITLGDVVRAFAKADNVHVSTFYSQADSLEQELWLSRERNILIVAAPAKQQRTLYDLNRKGKKEIDPAAATSDFVELDAQEHEGVLKIVDGCLGLSDVPRNARWSRTAGETETGVELYELTWAVETNRSAPVLMKRTVSVDPSTKLPQEIRQFRKLSAEGEWEEKLRSEFEYLTDDEMASAIQSQVPP